LRSCWLGFSMSFFRHDQILDGAFASGEKGEEISVLRRWAWSLDLLGPWTKVGVWGLGQAKAQRPKAHK
jgi:hypothetical protein